MGLRFRDPAPGQSAVENVPTDLRARDPAGQVGADIIFVGQTLPLVAAENLRARFETGFGLDDILAAQCLGLAQRGQFRTLLQGERQRGRQINIERRGQQGVAQLERHILPNGLGQVAAEQIEQVVFADAITVPRLNQTGALVGQLHPARRTSNCGTVPALKRFCTSPNSSVNSLTEAWLTIICCCATRTSS